MGEDGDSADEEGGDESDGSLDPADAFLIPAHEIRIDILRALWRAENHSLSFADLRTEVGVRDTGKFTYHLSKLEGRYVDHVEDRYELLYPGHRIVDAIQSGVFDQQIETRTIPLDATCPDCDDSLQFTYEDFIVRIRCPDCAETVLGYPFDPGGFAHETDEAVVRAFDRRTRRYWLMATDGVCPVCAGPTAVELVEEATTLQALDRYADHYASDQPAILATTCQHCSFYSYVSAGVPLLGTPAVVGRLYDAGVDVNEHHLWELDYLVDADCVSLVEAEPPEVVVTARVDGDREEGLRVTIDDSGSVVGID